MTPVLLAAIKTDIFQARELIHRVARAFSVDAASR
jgi:hypothetical protein